MERERIPLDVMSNGNSPPSMFDIVKAAYEQAVADKEKGIRENRDKAAMWETKLGEFIEKVRSRLKWPEDIWRVSAGDNSTNKFQSSPVGATCVVRMALDPALFDTVFADVQISIADTHNRDTISIERTPFGLNHVDEVAEKFSTMAKSALLKAIP